jgi:hypothetical protein
LGAAVCAGAYVATDCPRTQRRRLPDPTGTAVFSDVRAPTAEEVKAAIELIVRLIVYSSPLGKDVINLTVYDTKRISSSLSEQGKSTYVVSWCGRLCLGRYQDGLAYDLGI